MHLLQLHVYQLRQPSIYINYMYCTPASSYTTNIYYMYTSYTSHLPTSTTCTPASSYTTNIYYTYISYTTYTNYMYTTKPNLMHTTYPNFSYSSNTTYSSYMYTTYIANSSYIRNRLKI